MMPRLPFLPFPSYGPMLAIAFVAALILAWKLAGRAGLSPSLVQDVIVIASLWAIVGAKLLLIAVDPKGFLASPWSVLFQGGVFYGGVLAGLLGGWLRARQLALDPWAVGDVIAPCLALAHAIGRIGCLLAGCCYGGACDAPWAVHYSDPLAPSILAGIEASQGLHPTQLYEAAGDVALLAGLLALLPRRAFVGQAWWLYVAGYAILRLAVEPLRADARGSFAGLATSQWIGAAALVASVVMLVLLRRRAQAPAVAEESAP